MPIPDLPEPESPHADTRMLEFVERRREEQARARRQRIQIIAIIALGLIGIVLTVSNAVLVSRLVAPPVTPPIVAPPPVRSAAPPVKQGESAEPSAEPEASSASPTSRPPAGDAPAAPAISAVEPPAAARDEPPALPERVTRPARRAASAPESARPSAVRETLSSAVETDPALRTARWMIHTYGPLDAEGKALAAAEFYTGEEGDFWRRVVAHVRAER